MVIYLKIIFKHLFYIEYYIFLLLCNTDLEYSILLFRIKNKDILNLYIMTMEKYRQFISLLSDNHIDRVFLNSDEKHAIEVFVKLFETAKSTIRIYAACLCNEVTNDPRYIKALSDFIEKSGTLKILLNKYDRELAINSNLFKRLAYYAENEKPIYVKTTKSKFYNSGDKDKKEIHFTVVDNISYRLETDIEKRTAECNFNSEPVATNMASLFDEVFERSDETINLKEMFK